jgi:hypothetical protein
MRMDSLMKESSFRNCITLAFVQPSFAVTASISSRNGATYSG